MQENNRNEAWEFVNGIENPITRRMATFFLRRLELCVIQRRFFPDGDFDLLFFAKVVADALQDHLLLLRFLNGEEIGWFWPPETDEAGGGRG